jgi:predicted DNA-binding transcriptional regulator AlpA
VIRLETKQEAADRTGFHPESLMRLAKQKRFPRPIKSGAEANCAVRFLSDEIDQWIAERAAVRS